MPECSQQRRRDTQQQPYGVSASLCNNFSDYSVDRVLDRHRTFRRGQYFIERHRGERCGIVGHPAGNNELPAVQETAAAVNHVWAVAFALAFVWLDEWLRQAANIFGRVVMLEQGKAPMQYFRIGPTP